MFVESTACVGGWVVFVELLVRLLTHFRGVLVASYQLNRLATAFVVTVYLRVLATSSLRHCHLYGVQDVHHDHVDIPSHNLG